MQSGGFLGRFLGSLLKIELPLMKNLLKPLAKSVLTLLGLTAGALATDAVIQKKIHGSGTITLILSNKEMEDIMTTVKTYLQNNWKWSKELKGGSLSILLGKLGASLLGNLITGKGTPRWWKTNYSRTSILISFSSLANCDIKKYYEILSKYYTKKNPLLMMFIEQVIYLIKDGAYVENLEEYKSIGTHYRALNVSVDNIFW